MNNEQVSRRHFIKASGNMVGCAWLSLSLPAISAAGKAALDASNNKEAFRVLNAVEAAVVEAVAAQVIPSDDTPGAREAKVIYFIDNVLQSEQADTAEIVKEGATALDAQTKKQHGKRFVELTNDQQIAMLQQIEDEPFFDVVRFLTICGMFSNPSYGGNQDKLGWQLMEFNDRGIWQPPFGYYDAQELKVEG